MTIQRNRCGLGSQSRTIVFIRSDPGCVVGKYRIEGRGHIFKWDMANRDVVDSVPAQAEQKIRMADRLWRGGGRRQAETKKTSEQVMAPISSGSPSGDGSDVGNGAYAMLVGPAGDGLRSAKTG